GPSVPEGRAAVVKRAMAKQRGDRYPDALALQADLEALLAGPSDDTPIMSRLPAIQPPVAEAQSRRAWLWAAGAVGVAGAGGLAGLGGFRGREGGGAGFGEGARWSSPSPHSPPLPPPPVA